MFSGIVMLVLGTGLLAYSIFKFFKKNTYLGIVYLCLSIVALAGGIILIVLSN